MRVAYFSPDAARAELASPTTARCSFPRCGSGSTSTVVRAGARGLRAVRTRRSTTWATTRTPTAGSSTRSGAAPGVVVLHDFVLHHLVAGMTVGRGDGHGYLDAMEREHGVVGRLLGPRRPRQAHPATLGVAAGGLPARVVVLESATGLIVHSRYVADRARVAGLHRAGLRSSRTPPGRFPASRPNAIADGPVIGCFGIVNSSKRIRSCSTRSRRCARSIRRCTLLLVGPTSPGFDLDRRLQRLGLARGRARARGVGGRGAAVVADGAASTSS